MTTKRGTWSEEELEFLRKYYPEKKGKWVAEQLNRGFHATHKMAKKIGVKAKWKHIYYDKQGYVVDTSIRDKKEYVHRRVMEEHIGRKLRNDEIVHHIDGNKRNNDISNLEITNRKDHINMHREDLMKGKR